MILHIELAEHEMQKLEALAKARNRSVVDCIREFIATCQPGGSGWEHPEKAASHLAERERAG